MTQSASAATYYVDSQSGDDRNDGRSVKQAWKSLQKVNETVLQPGDRLLFKSGTRYEGQLKPQGSGAVVEGKPRPIVIDRFGTGPLPRIDGEGKHLETLYLYNAAYWEINHLEITNQGPERQPNRKGVYIHLKDFGTAHHVKLQNLYIHDVNGSNVKKEGGGAGILWNAEGKVKPSRFDGLLIENCRLERCDRNGIIGGGYWRRSEWFPSLHVVIRGNHLDDIGGDGIVPIACDGALVEKNVVRNAGQRFPEGDSSCGIWPWSCDNTTVQFNEVSGMRGPWDAQGYDSDWNCKNTIIQYNYSHDNEGGFLLICNDGGQLKSDSVGNFGTIARYNLSVNDGYRVTGRSAGFSPVFHVTGSTENTHVYNNTVVVGKKPAGADGHIVTFDTWNGWPKDTNFTNNILFAEDTVQYKYGQAVGVRFNNNLYWGRHENAPDDPQAVRKDPLFFVMLMGKPGPIPDYRLRKGSPALDAGITVSHNGGRDLLGRPLPKDSPPSLGALEGATGK